MIDVADEGWGLLLEHMSPAGIISALIVALKANRDTPKQKQTCLMALRTLTSHTELLEQEASYGLCVLLHGLLKGHARAGARSRLLVDDDETGAIYVCHRATSLWTRIERMNAYERVVRYLLEHQEQSWPDSFRHDTQGVQAWHSSERVQVAWRCIPERLTCHRGACITPPRYMLRESLQRPNGARMCDVRAALRRYFSWWITTDEGLDFIAGAAQGSIISIGAGTGWAESQLAARGLDVQAWDTSPPHLLGSTFCAPITWHPVKRMHHPYAYERDKIANITLAGRWGADIDFSGPTPPQGAAAPNEAPGLDEIMQDSQGHTLMLAWPPYSTHMALHALEHFKGDLLVYVGEYSGGCTGCGDFHAALDTGWMLEQEQRILRWWGINDTIQVYRRQS